MGLLSLIKPILKEETLSKYSGKRVGIDGNIWLHDIASEVSYELYKKTPTTRHLKIFKEKIETLTSNQITPIFVFDGDQLPVEKVNRKKKNNAKKEHIKSYHEEMEKGNNEEAEKHIKYLYTMSQELIYSFLKELEELNIEYIIAPYEADPELIYLEKIKYIDYIMTGDSDLIAMGGKKILYDFDGQTVKEYNSEDLPGNFDASFTNNLLDICILSGCDYFSSINNTKLKQVIIYFKETKTVENYICRFVKKNRPNERMNHFENFYRAKNIFMHQVIYDPISKSRKPLNPIEEVYDYLGSLVPSWYGVSDELYIRRHYRPDSNHNIIYQTEEEYIED